MILVAPQTHDGPAERSHARRSTLPGQSVVEMAVMLPILITLLMGVADVSRAFYAYIELRGAVRSGAQYGVQSRITAANYSAMQTAAANAAPDLSGMKATASSFCTCSDGGSVISCSSPGNCGNPELFVQVNANATFTTLIRYPGLPASMPLQASAVMQVK